MDVWHELRSPAVPEPEVPREPLKVFLGETEGEEGPWICREKGLKPERLAESIISSLPKTPSYFNLLCTSAYVEVRGELERISSLSSSS